MNTKPLILVAAYGSRYENSQQAQEDWQAGKDFRVYPTSTYCSIRDLKYIRDNWFTCDIINAHGQLYNVF